MEGALRVGPEPRELRVLVAERAFADHESLTHFTRGRDAERRERRGPEGEAALRVVVVTLGEPGVRDLGEAAPVPAKPLRGLPS